jgi:hypothetical protein
LNQKLGKVGNKSLLGVFMNFTAETKEKIIDDMCKMIHCATVSYQDDELVDWSQYEKFQNLLRKNFPTIYQKCDFFKVGKTGLVHKISGKNAKTQNKCANVLMAHYDVVPAVQEELDFLGMNNLHIDDKISGVTLIYSAVHGESDFNAKVE